MTWQDVIREFKTKSSKGHGAAAILVLMYLTFGEDYPYHMATFFAENLSVKNGWKDGQLNYFKKLLDLNALQTLLASMGKKKLLCSHYIKEEGRKRHYFALNPIVLCFSDSTLGYCPIHQRDAKMKWEKDNSKVNQFLIALGNRDRLSNFKRWNTIELFDFITFYEFLMHEALELGMDEMAKILISNISSLKMSENRHANMEALKKSKAMDKRRQIKSDISKPATVREEPES